jgi:DNA mismatch endonuclease Vsr
LERLLKEKLPLGAFENVDPIHRRIMKGVRGKGNRTTEGRFRAAMVSAAISGWKLNYRQILGSPDFYFPEERLALFVDGCFWHGCHSCGHIPNKNREFWDAKIRRNRERDSRNTSKLRRQGIAVLRFWEHEVRDSLGICILKLKKKLTKRNNQLTNRIKEHI